MRTRFLIISLLLCCLSCNTESEEKSDIEDKGTEAEITFDKKKWRIKEGEDYPYRDQMVKDLVYNDTVRMLREDEIIELLGEPDRINEGHLYYTITQKRLGSWVLHSKTMVIKLTEDYRIDWIKIHE